MSPWTQPLICVNLVYMGEFVLSYLLNPTTNGYGTCTIGVSTTKMVKICGNSVTTPSALELWAPEINHNYFIVWLANQCLYTVLNYLWLSEDIRRTGAAGPAAHRIICSQWILEILVTSPSGLELQASESNHDLMRMVCLYSCCWQTVHRCYS